MTRSQGHLRMDCGRATMVLSTACVSISDWAIQFPLWRWEELKDLVHHQHLGSGHSG